MNAIKQRFILTIGWISIIILSAPVCDLIADTQEKRNIYVIPISGDIDPGMAAYLNRALTDITDEKGLYIIELDTNGGRVDSALQMVDDLVNIPKNQTIAFVSKKAYSAGALIALSCNKLAMKHHTAIGDCAPITYSNEGPQMMGEKFQSPLRAKFRALAKRNGYPETLAESMVTMDMEVFRVELPDRTLYMDTVDFQDMDPDLKKRVISKKTVVKKGELLTMDDTEAVDLGFSMMSVQGIDDLLRGMGITQYTIHRTERKWSESLVSVINTIAPVLMLIGLAALYTELKAPGFGAPGLIGIICLGLVFLNQYLVGLADYTELIIIVLGFVLLAAEFFVIPGFGIAGISGFFFIAVGMILAFQDFVIPDPEFPWEGELLKTNILYVLSSILGAFLISMMTLRYVFPKLTRVVPGPYLSATLKDSHADSMEAGTAKIGDRGIALTFLRPSGKAKIGEEIYDVITEAEFIEKDSPLIISDIRGNRIIVTLDRSK